MREIKFRVWWIHPESDSSGFDYFKAGEALEQGDSLQEYMEMEQFTGLRDKNGKEIYEGDIVSIEHILVYERTVSHPKRNAIMTWDEGETGFRLSSDSVKNTNPDIYPVCCLEVIGNIHENPELLEAAK